MTGEMSIDHSSLIKMTKSQKQTFSWIQNPTVKFWSSAEYKQELSMNGVIPEKASEAIQVGAQTEGNLGVVQVSKGVDMINKGISLDAIDYCPEQNLPLNNDVFLTRTKASVSDCMN